MYGIFTYICHILPLKTTIHVGKYTFRPMDGMSDMSIGFGDMFHVAQVDTNLVTYNTLMDLMGQSKHGTQWESLGFWLKFIHTDPWGWYRNTYLDLPDM